MIFFIPGFVSLKVYDLVVPGGKRDFSKSIFEIVAYSALNYAIFFFILGSIPGAENLAVSSWIALLVSPQDFYLKFGWFTSALLLLGALIILPSALPIIFNKLTSLEWIASRTVSSIPKPWDYVFGGYGRKKRGFWIIVHLKDGSRIGGKYGKYSYASSYPEEDQLYLEQVYYVDENGKFEQPVPRSQGMIIRGDEILAVEFFE